MGIGTLTPNPNAALDIESNDKGLLIPRLDPAQRAAIQLGLGAAETGLLVFDPVDELFYYWDNTQAVWIPFSDDQNIDSVVLNADTTLTVYIENGASATVDVRPLINDPEFDPTYEIHDLARNATLDSLLISLGGTGVALTDLDRQDLIYDAISDSLLITNGAGIDLDSIDNQGIDSFSISGTVLTVHIENGSPASIDLAGLPTIKDLDSAILNPDSTLTIYIEAALPTTVDLSSLFDNTDAQTLSLNATGTELSISNGNTVTLVDADSTNELQDLSLNSAGDSLLISNGQGILLSGIDNQNIDSFVLNSDSTLTVFIQDGSSATVDVSSLFDNTDDQNITSVVLNADSTVTVNIENGTSASVDLSSLFDNTDDQDITSVVLNADSTLTVNIENGASATADLSSIFDNTDNQNIDSVVLNGTVATVFIEDGSSASVDLASLIDDADADPTNEFQNLSFNGTGDSLLISNGTGVELTGIDNQNIDSVILNADSTITVFIEDGLPATVDVSSLFDNTDAQTLSLNAAGTELSISNGNTVTLVDADSTNELQSLLVDRITDSLYISGLNGDTLMGIDLNDVITCVIPPQNLTYAIMDGDTLEIDIEGGDSVRVDLSQFLDNTDNQDITSVVLNADSTITVNIENGASATVDVAAIFDNTDDQNLDSISLAGTVATVFIEGGASASIDLASLVDDADADPTNELQDLSFNGAGDSLLISNGLGVALSGIDNQDITSIVLNGDSSLTVNIEDGASATVDLTSLFDNTDDQDITSVVLNADSTLTVNIEDGASATVDISSAFDNTDDQNITSVVLNADSTITVNIENGASATVDISSAFDNTDDQNITSVVLNADSTITVNIENGTSATVDISSAFDNTDDQNITSVVLNADSTLTVNIENGSSATVDLTSAFDNTDDQNIDSVVLNGTVATVYIEGGSAASVDLASLIDDADADPTNELNTSVALNGTDLEVTDAGGTITTDLSSLVDDADADPTNELQDLSINAANDSILISNGQGISLGSIDTDDQNLDSAVLNNDSTLSIFIQDGASTSVDLSSVFDNTDAQTLSLNATGTELSISNGNTVTLVDADSTNELQSLLVDRITDSLYISGLNGDTLMGIDLNDVITCVIPPQNLTYAIMDGDTLEIDIEGGDSVRVDLSQFLDNTDNQDITSVVLNPDSTITVNIQNGASATVDVAAIFDNTDDQNLDSISLAGTVATVFIEGGSSASIDLASLVDDADDDPTNELNTGGVLNGTDLEVTDAGGTITADLSSLVDDADADPTNELTTGVVLNGTDLEVTDAGGTITTDLSSLVDDADADPTNEFNTSVVLNGTNLETSDAGGTIITDLSSLVDDADADPTNELQDLSINATNDSILISNGLGIPAGGIPLSALDTDEQNIDSAVLNGAVLTVYIEDGSSASVDLTSLIDDADADPTNELQTLIVDRVTDSLYISGATGDTLMGIDLNDVITCVIPPQNLTYATLIGDILEIDIEGGDSVRVDLSSLGSNDLDDAYDEGGPGVGRIITASDGPVEIQGGDGLMVSATGVGISSPLPNIPNGTSIMYYSPTKGAFRAGSAGNNRWDDASVGSYSWAGGSNSLASGSYSFAFGNTAVASGLNAIAFGPNVNVFRPSAIGIGGNTQVGGTNAISIGTNNRIDNDNSFTIGTNNIARSTRSVLIGDDNEGTASQNFAIGLRNFVRGFNAIAIGNDNDLGGNQSITLGRDNIINTNSQFTYSIGNNLRINGSNEIVIGQYNNINTPFSQSWDVRDRLFTVGNGQTAGTRSNAMTILKSGNVGLGNTAEGLNPPNLLTLDNGAIDPLKINNLATDNSLNQILVIDGNGVVHVRDIGTLPIPAPGPGSPGGLGMVDINALQQTVIDQQGQIDALMQQNQDLLFRLEQLELGNNPTNP